MPEIFVPIQYDQTTVNINTYQQPPHFILKQKFCEIWLLVLTVVLLIDFILCLKEVLQ